MTKALGADVKKIFTFQMYFFCFFTFPNGNIAISSFAIIEKIPSLSFNIHIAEDLKLLWAFRVIHILLSR